MQDNCKNGQCVCEEEENFFHVKIAPQNNANFSAAEEETLFSYEFESNSLSDKDAMGREVFWEDMGRP
jgi:hypothetical protein